MSLFIITGDVSSSGCLSVARRPVSTLGLWPRLLVGPPPEDAKVTRIFGPRDRTFEDAFESRRGPLMPRDGRRLPGSLDGLKPLCRAFDHIEFWFDPDAESQLALALVLDYLREDRQIVSKIILLHPDRNVGGLTPEVAKSMQPPREPLSKAHLVLASRVWSAWASPSPEQIYDLLSHDLSALPFLRLNIERILRELPAGDFAEAGPRARWWGATELTSERLWRWDAGARTLKKLG